MNKLNDGLILLGLLLSAGISIYEAQPWGNNYAHLSMGVFTIIMGNLYSFDDSNQKISK
jgi:hypothetical protein